MIGVQHDVPKATCLEISAVFNERSSTFKRNDKPPSLQSKKEYPDVRQAHPNYNNIQQSNECFLDFECHGPILRKNIFEK